MSLLSTIRSVASSSRSRSRSAVRMSIIQEDSVYTPGMSYRPTSSQFYLEHLPNSSFEAPPPAYVFAGAKFSTTTSKSIEPSQNSILSQRTSWRRSAFGLLLILCLAGLVLGLSVGLTQKGHNGDSMKDHGPDNSSPAVPIASPFNTSSTTFPSGNFTIPTLLSDVTTNCTSLSSTWRCFPFSSYSSSKSILASTTTFLFNIQQIESTNTYTISSTSPNKIAPSFSSIPLILTNDSLPTEHYSFQINTTKVVIPGTAVDDSNVASTCYFNSTLFQGVLYTQLGRLYPNVTSSDLNSDVDVGGGDWPYAVELVEMASGGVGVPVCYDNEGNEVGSFMVEDTDQECVCNYNNFRF